MATELMIIGAWTALGLVAGLAIGYVLGWFQGLRAGQDLQKSS